MNDERPIVFTLTELNEGVYQLQTTDSRAGNTPSPEIPDYLLFGVMSLLSERFNAKGYSVLFEVD